MGRKTNTGRKGRGRGQSSESSHSQKVQEENLVTQPLEVKTTELPPIDSSKTSTPTKFNQNPLQKTPSKTKLNTK